MKTKYLVVLILVALLVLICLIDCCWLLRWVTDTEIYSGVRQNGVGKGYGLYSAREGGGEDGTPVQLLALTEDTSREIANKHYYIIEGAVLDARRTDTLLMKLDSVIMLWEADSAVPYGRKLNYYNDNVGRRRSCDDPIGRQSQQVLYLHRRENKMAQIFWVNYYSDGRGGGEVRLRSIEELRRLRDMLAQFRPSRRR